VARLIAVCGRFQSEGTGVQAWFDGAIQSFRDDHDTDAGGLAVFLTNDAMRFRELVILAGFSLALLCVKEQNFNDR